MRTSVAKADRRLEVQSLDLPLIGQTPDRPATVQPLDGAPTTDLLACLADAIDVTTKREAAAAQMGVNHSQMTRQLKGEGHKSLKRAGYLDRDTHIAFARNILRACGQDDPKVATEQDAQQIATALMRIVARVR